MVLTTYSRLIFIILITVGVFLMEAPTSEATESSLSPAQLKQQYGWGDQQPRGSHLLGWSKLFRRENEIEVLLVTNDLPSGAYTVWWNIVNYPGKQEPGFSYIRAGGRVVEADGRLIFSAVLKKGEGAPDDPKHHRGPGLLNPRGANVTIIIRDHGPVQPRRGDLTLQDQLTSWGGGCNNASPNLGTPGDYFCVNRQLAVHPAMHLGKALDRMHVAAVKPIPLGRVGSP
ncbi:MAG: hypothetical protein AAF629_12445 [Chloroflexota bacterium]